MRVLFIKLKNIGDTIIMTPVLTAARALWPTATIDVLVRRSTQGILAGSLALDNIYTSVPPEGKKWLHGEWLADIRLIAQLRKHKYDWIFELSDNDRGRLMAILIGARNIAATDTFEKIPFWAAPFIRHRSQQDYGRIHRCQKDVGLLRSFCGYNGDTPPMEFDRSFVDWSWAQQHLTTAPIVLHPFTRWQRKMWPTAKWQELAVRLAKLAPIVISSGGTPAELETARQIASVVPAGRVLMTEGRLTWAQMAALMYSARMLVSVDTAALHLGSACGTPIVGLFGPTFDAQWGPWQTRSQVVTPISTDPIPQRKTADITVDQVWERVVILEGQAGH